jgi:hypothetical protein
VMLNGKRLFEVGAAHSRSRFYRCSCTWNGRRLDFLEVGFMSFENGADSIPENFEQLST